MDTSAACQHTQHSRAAPLWYIRKGPPTDLSHPTVPSASTFAALR